MLCFREGCDQPARAICAFCGRAVCRDHFTNMSTFLTMYVGKNNVPKGLAVAKVVWCGICEPQPEPIEMPELY